MKKKFILSVDQGTTSTRAIIFDREGKIAAKAQRELTQIYPRSAYVEHNPTEILSGTFGVISEALASIGISASELDSMGITNQRETVIAWDKFTGQPLYNAIVWQCRRSAKRCDELKESAADGMIFDKTGLLPDAYFSATKIEWLIKNVEEVKKAVKEDRALFGTVDTYLMWHLSGGKIFATDYTNASRTMLFNIHKLDWDDELLNLFSVPRACLAKVYPSGHDFGCTDRQYFGAEVKICGVAGDQQSSLFGHLCTEAGSIKNTYGTGCFLLMNSGEKAVKSKRGLLTSLAASFDDKPQYILEGSVFVGGAAVQWLRDEMRMIRSSAESERYASSVEDTGGVYFVPAFVGLGAPHWNSEARGLVCGMTRGTKKEHFVRAALESIAYQVFDILHAMERDTDLKINRLDVDGGACANNFLMQFQSDILGCDVIRPSVLETTALGVAYLAGLKTGFYESIEALRKLKTEGARFCPKMDKERATALIFGWEDAVMRTKSNSII